MGIELKDRKGSALIKKLCCPRTPTKTNASLRLHPADAPKDFADLYAYNAQDIISEASVSDVVPELSDVEEQVWQLDQQINVRGVAIDTESLAHCLSIVRQVTLQLSAELKEITQSPGITVDSIQQLRGWLAANDVPTSSLDKGSVASLLKRTDLPPQARQVLEIRQVLGSASVKKLYALDRYVGHDGRIRGLYIYCGARQTGRFSGTGPQPQNIPGGGPDVVKCRACNGVSWEGLNKCRHCANTDTCPLDWGVEAAELALQDIATRSTQHVTALWGNPIKAVSGCLRALFVAAPGCDLICSDYTAIEAVVLAALAGEEWRMEVFRTHGKIYEMSASKISGVPFQDFMKHKEETGQHHPLRKKVGKVAELASGYAGWINAWKNFGADQFMDDQEIKEAVLAWRAESPMIVEFWGGQWRKHPTRWEFTFELYGLEGAAVQAIAAPGVEYKYRDIAYQVVNNVLYCTLPSGRQLIYHQPRLSEDTSPAGKPIYKITFEGWNSDSTKGPIGWMRRETFGGRLAENVTQAVARDIFAQGGLLQVNGAGYPIVLHTHDEMTAEVPENIGTVDELEACMTTLPEWCKDWPIKVAGGWRGKRYRKD